MAYIPPEEKDKQQQGTMNVMAPSVQPDQPQVSGAPAPIQTGGAVGTGGASPDQTQQGARGQKGSGMFTDIRKFVSANRPQAQRISQAIAGRQEEQAQRVGQAVSK